MVDGTQPTSLNSALARAVKQRNNNVQNPQKIPAPATVIHPAVIAATEQITDSITIGNRAQAVKTASDTLKQAGVKGVDNLSPRQTLKLYNDYLKVIVSVEQRVEQGEITEDQAFDLITEKTNQICNLRIDNQQRAHAARRAQESFHFVVKHASGQQLSKCARSLIRAQNAIIGLARSITDADSTLRKQVLSEIGASNAELAKDIVNKLGTDNESANVFISGVQIERNLHKISCDLTEQVVKMIFENRKEQNRLDVLAADKKEEEVNEVKKQDETYAAKKQDEAQSQVKVADNKSKLKGLQVKLDQMISPNPEDVEGMEDQISAIISETKTA